MIKPTLREIHSAEWKWICEHRKSVVVISLLAIALISVISLYVGMKYSAWGYAGFLAIPLAGWLSHEILYRIKKNSLLEQKSDEVPRSQENRLKVNPTSVVHSSDVQREKDSEEERQIQEYHPEVKPTPVVHSSDGQLGKDDEVIEIDTSKRKQYLREISALAKHQARANTQYFQKPKYFS